MSHKITTTVTHLFDLTETEQFEAKGFRKTPLRIDKVKAEIVDGSLSRVELFGQPVLKSGGLGTVRGSVDVWKPFRGPWPADILAVLAVHGIPVSE